MTDIKVVSNLKTKHIQVASQIKLCAYQHAPTRC